MADKEISSFYYIKTYSGALLPDSYMNYVLAKWMRSFRYGNDYIRLTDSGAYYAAYESYIRKILNINNTLIRLAVLSDDSDVTLGFSVVAGKVLHYVYVGLDYRGRGIAKLMVPGKIEEFTHLTKSGLTIWQKKLPEAVFNPFAF